MLDDSVRMLRTLILEFPFNAFNHLHDYSDPFVARFLLAPSVCQEVGYSLMNLIFYKNIGNYSHKMKMFGDDLVAFTFNINLLFILSKLLGHCWPLISLLFVQGCQINIEYAFITSY